MTDDNSPEAEGTDAASAPPPSPKPARFPVVGLGASAGGLEALQGFLRNVPADSGMAFVVVSHMDPDHPSMLPEILRRAAMIPVTEAQDGMVFAPNHAYVAPPNSELSLVAGALCVTTPDLPRGQRMPIDHFFESVASDRGELAVGVVLSGTGTDGTFGLRAILGNGGLSVAQDPATATFDGMPASAIAAGFARRVLQVAEMPAAIIADLDIRRSGVRQPLTPAQIRGLNRVLSALRSVSGQDFSHYKKATVSRRVTRRMQVHHIEDLEIYARYVQEHPTEARALVAELLINVTSFFRDPEAFAVLKRDVLSRIVASAADGHVIRVWVAGCSSGEEAYSIAILLRELMAETHAALKVQIFATDVDDDAVALARVAVYPAASVAGVGRERLERFFVKDDSGYRISREIRDMVIVATQNVVKDPPFTKLDLVSCRNLLIYLDAAAQEQVIASFHYALKPGGALFLSPSESIGDQTDLFAPVDRTWKIYEAKPKASRTLNSLPGHSGSHATQSVPQKPTTSPEPKPALLNPTEIIRRALLQWFAPPAVLTDATGNILFVHGETGRYLRPAPGQATFNVIEMAREGLQLPLRKAFQLLRDDAKGSVDVEAAFRADDADEIVRLGVRAVSASAGGETLALVTFEDPAEASRKLRRKASRRGPASVPVLRVEELERELAYTTENLQATIEEKQAAIEELQSTNEELQSTNEEMQSTNEELETSKEELQSVNEEMTTVNAELRAKIEQLAGTRNDLKNLLDNISIGTIFLDRDLAIRSFTREALAIYHLVKTDVGRPLSDFKPDIDEEDLLADAEAVMASLVPREREVRTPAGAWYLARVQPYRTLENVIDGVVLTFSDITPRVKADAVLREAREFAEAIVDTVRDPLLVLDENLDIVAASRSFHATFRTSAAGIVGHRFFELDDGQWDSPVLREALQQLLPQNRVIEDLQIERQVPGKGIMRIRLNARRLHGEGTPSPKILLSLSVDGTA